MDDMKRCSWCTDLWDVADLEIRGREMVCPDCLAEEDEQDHLGEGWEE